eukprot:m.128449 g.128449  ORF g.128449 m.128449 type:complete len:61 (-) comp11238_c0_seq1:1502-1684(-)
MWGLILVRHHGPSNAHSVLSDNKEQEWVLAGPMPPDVFEHRYMVIALDLYSKRIDVTPIV